MQDGGLNVRCEHQCKQQWAETATYEDVCCFCFVVSVFVAFGVRTLQLCFCFVASVFAAVGARTIVFARSLARSLAVFFHWLIVQTIALHVLSTMLQYSPAHK